MVENDTICSLLDYSYEPQPSNLVRRRMAKRRANYLTITVLHIYRVELKDLNRINCSLDLSLLMSMPMDILFEIFRNLHPVDLGHLRVASHMFNEAIKCIGNILWKASFEEFASEMLIPSPISASKWAQLLFGPSVCEECDNVHAPFNVTHLQRLCHECHLRRFTDDEAGEYTEAHALCQAAKFIHLTPDPNEDNPTLWPRYLLSDLKQLLEELEASGKVIDNERQRFKKQKLEEIDSVKTVLSAWLSWGQGLSEILHRRIEDVLTSMENDFRRRVLGLHLYEPQDVDAVEINSILKPYVLDAGVFHIRRNWFAQARRLVGPFILEKQEERFREERKEVVNLRKELFRVEHRRFLSTTPPTTWADTPPRFVIMTIEPFNSIINQAHSEPLTGEDFAEGLKTLPAFYEQWKLLKMKELASYLPPELSRPEETGEADILSIDRATSVYYCKGSLVNGARPGRCLLGWEYVAPHLRCGSLEHYWDHRLYFSETGHRAAVELVMVCGLDPITAMVWNMDALDPRIVCLSCQTSSSEGRTVWTWREALCHYLLTEHTEPAWCLLGEEAAADVKCRQGCDLRNADKVWGCAHCGYNLVEDFKPRREVRRHVRNEHHITEPVQNLDYIYFGGSPPHFHKITIPNEHHPQLELSCLHCSEARKLFTSHSLRRHLKNKHHITNGVEGNDFKKVSVVVRVTEKPVDVAVPTTRDTQ